MTSSFKNPHLEVATVCHASDGIMTTSILMAGDLKSVWMCVCVGGGGVER